VAQADAADRRHPAGRPDPAVLALVEVTAEIAVATPHQHVRQVSDLTYSKRQLSHDNAMDAVHAIICRETRRHAPGAVLAVLQADPEARLKERGHLPANVARHTTTPSRGGMNGAR
jgi:hypothetical protein